MLQEHFSNCNFVTSDSIWTIPKCINYRVCPILWTRPTACCSAAGFSAGSHSMTCVASVMLSPLEPVCRGRRRTPTLERVLKALRLLWRKTSDRMHTWAIHYSTAVLVMLYAYHAIRYTGSMYVTDMYMYICTYRRYVQLWHRTAQKKDCLRTYVQCAMYTQYYVVHYS